MVGVPLAGTLRGEGTTIRLPCMVGVPLAGTLGAATLVTATLDVGTPAGVAAILSYAYLYVSFCFPSLRAAFHLSPLTAHR